jgi:hypothetical protein
MKKQFHFKLSFEGKVKGKFVPVLTYYTMKAYVGVDV